MHHGKLPPPWACRRHAGGINIHFHSGTSVTALIKKAAAAGKPCPAAPSCLLSSHTFRSGFRSRPTVTVWVCLPVSPHNACLIASIVHTFNIVRSQLTFPPRTTAKQVAAHYTRCQMKQQGHCWHIGWVSQKFSLLSGTRNGESVNSGDTPFGQRNN